MKKSDLDLSLYLVTDRKNLAKPLEEIVEGAIRGGVSLVQLREKEADSHTLFLHALEMKRITDAFHIPLIINDRLDIMLAAGADGVHLGQSDIPVHIARNLLGSEKIIGASAHSVKEALREEKEGADYIGAGALFVTDTKEDASSMALETFHDICKAVSIPVVGIGGITAGNIIKLADSGLAGVAVSSAMLRNENPKEEASLLKTKIERIKAGNH